MSTEANHPDDSRLRAAAEARLDQAPAALASDRPMAELLHELRVHQIELEMQNENIRGSLLALEESRDRYASFYEIAPVGYLALSDLGLIADINLPGAAMLGRPREALLQSRFASFVAPFDQDRWHLHFINVLGHDGKLDCELALQVGEASLRHVRLDSLRLTKEGQAPSVRVVLTDISERKKTEEALRAREQFFRMIAENVEDFLVVLDLDGRRLYNSPSYARFFGNIEALKGTDSFAEIHPEDRGQVEHAFKETVRSGTSHRLNFRFLLPDGGIRYMESCGALIRNSRGQPLHVVVVSRDVTERVENEEEIRHLAFYDSLTRLPNRRLLDDRLDQARALSKRSRRYGALMFLDLDNFKPLNDGHGHFVGDLLLTEAARRISSSVREMDTVARFGGDEFVVVLSELDVDRAQSLVQSGVAAEKIRAALSEPYVLKITAEGQAETVIEHHCTVSIGVVLFLNHDARTEDLLKWADMAMYSAKEAGRNSIRFYDSGV